MIAVTETGDDLDQSSRICQSPYPPVPCVVSVACEIGLDNKLSSHTLVVLGINPVIIKHTAHFAYITDVSSEILLHALVTVRLYSKA